MSESHPPIPVLLGPTASGKTSLGIALARHLKGEIISVDSRKVYKGLTIGTAVPKGIKKNNALWVEDIPHYLIGHLRPDQPYTAGDFAKEANQLIQEIFKRGHLPILVGGTGFYFKALQKGLPSLPPRNEKIRQRLSDFIHQEGLPSLFTKLSHIDPQAAEAIQHNDTHKIIRALEIYELTGIPYSTWNKTQRTPSPFRFLPFGLDYEKEKLDRRIEERSKKMVEEGMIEETEKVLQQGYSPQCPALASFGYREAVEVLEGKRAISDFLPSLIRGTKAYAKRQRTWFRTQISPIWFQCDSAQKEHIISDMLDRLHHLT